MELKFLLQCLSASIFLFCPLLQVLGKCNRQCDLSLAYFNVSLNWNTSYVQTIFNNRFSLQDLNNYNPGQTISTNYLQGNVRYRVPFNSCYCQRLPDGTSYLGNVFNYTVSRGETYVSIANDVYKGLTTASWLQKANTYAATSLQPGSSLNISINCSCGDATINENYGLFMTYPLSRVGKDTLSNLSSTYGISEQLIRAYNPDVDFQNFSGIAFIPVRDLNNSYRPLKSESGSGSIGVIIGVSVASIVALLLVAFGLYLYFDKNKKAKASFLSQSQVTMLHANGLESSALTGSTGITVDKSVEFTYAELASATNNFSLANKIGEGGFGAVYYGELRGEKAAIKKMDMEATQEFTAELKVLTHVHHLNLVRLIGFCTEESLFLAYEFIDNGNLSQHLHGSAMEPLSWAARVQIALDSARGLEYIHEHTVPVYIHRDIKSANILIDKNYRAKVADFGLTKLAEVGGGKSTSLQSRLVGTFGYMPPEYAQFGDVSPKVDVYAFGVVLYELISAKQAIVRTNDASVESRGLVALFESVWTHPNGREALKKLIDPRLEQNYSLESIWKMAVLAMACIQENPELRPNMRTVVVALMTLSSFSEESDTGSAHDSKDHLGFMRGT